MKIAVLSDTHGLLRPEVLEQIESCDALIHAGDIGSQRIIDEIFIHLKPRVPVYFVRGNNDGAWASHLLKCQRLHWTESISVWYMRKKMCLGI